MKGRPFRRVLLINVVMPTECLGGASGDDAARTKETLATALERDVAAEGILLLDICINKS